jgi:sulfur-carrier protein adenylyltransferase/sulfurtransferase
MVLLVPFPPLVSPADSLSADEVLRYSRHLIIPEIGTEGQRRLKNSKVLCVGAGGLGSPVLMYLAAAGVGTLGIVDFDVVDQSNLQRQIVHGQSDVGRSKAQSARESVMEINPLITVNLHETRLDRTNAMEIFAEYDLIVDGTDNFATRYLINDAAVLLGKPYVWGSIYRFDGQASVFWPQYGPCYRCIHPEPPPAGSVPSCAEGGVLGVLCASIGSIQVNEAIKVITGVGHPLVGRLVVHDALQMSYREIPIRKDPQCSLCSEGATQKTLLDNYEAFCGINSEVAMTSASGGTITVHDLKAKMDSGEAFHLVDVREPGEFEIVRIPGGVLLPQQHILDGSALPTLPTDRPVILYCRSGVRSADCLAVLHRAGFDDATHVGGGVLAWAREIDTTLPVY